MLEPKAAHLLHKIVCDETVRFLVASTPCAINQVYHRSRSALDKNYTHSTKDEPEEVDYY